ncbi:MAG: hypothetical protein KBT12_01400 [Bacteroidales bacterium]|nr:hypothetical protein [Candidatus Physcousia equi]
MKKLILTAAMALSLFATTAAAQEEMPDTTNLEQMFERIKEEPNNEAKFNNYYWLLNKTVREMPENWDLRFKVLHNMGVMQIEVGAKEQALQLFEEAKAVVKEPLSQGIVRALYYDATVRLNLTNVFTANDQQERLVEELEVSMKEYQEFEQKADRNDSVMQEYLEDIEVVRTAGYAALCFACQKSQQYEKAVDAGLRSIAAWEACKDVEDKNGMLYFRYMAGTEVCRCAQKSGKMDVFHKEVKGVEAFLSDVYTKLGKREIKADAQTRTTLSGMCAMLVEAYGNLNEYQRCKELSLLAVRFSPKDRNITNYELSRALIKCDHVDEAAHIHAEIMKDAAFVEEMKLEESDPVGDMLKEVAQASKFDMKSTVADAQGGGGDISGLANALNRSLNTSPAHRGGAKIVLEGYTAQNMVPYREKNGRVVLPIDRREVKGFGVSVKW